MSQKRKGVIMKKAAPVHESSSEQGNRNIESLTLAAVYQLWTLEMTQSVCILRKIFMTMRMTVGMTVDSEMVMVMTKILSAEVVSGSRSSVDKANDDLDSCKVAKIAELAQTILEEVREIFSVTYSTGAGNVYFGDSSTQLSTSNEPPGLFPSSSLSTSYPPPKFESDSVHSLLSRLAVY
jgi:hypothetical protein